MATSESSLKRKQKIEAETGDFLRGQIKRIPTEGQAVVSDAQARRSQFMGGLGLPQELVAAQTPRLNRNLEGLTARSNYDRSGLAIDDQLNYYFELATQAGMDVQDAMEFARKKAALTREQEVIAGENQLDRSMQERLLQLQDLYAQRGIDLQNRYSDSGNAAYMRLIGGAIGAAGTAYAMRPRENQAQPQTQPATAGLGGNYNALYDRYYGEPVTRSSTRTRAGMG